MLTLGVSKDKDIACTLGMPTGVKKRLMGHSINGDIDLIHYSALAFDDLKGIYDRYWNDVRIHEPPKRVREMNK